MASKEEKIYQIPKFISVDDVLKVAKRGNTTVLILNGRTLPQEEVAALRGEARDFKKSFLWQLMSRDVHYLAYLQATAKAATHADLVYAGAMYRDLEILEEFINRCAAL